MEDLLSQFAATSYSVHRALDNFKKIGKANYTYGIVRNRLQQLKHNYAECEALHGRILAASRKEARADHEYFTADQFSACEESFFTASDYIADWLHRLELQPTASGLDASSVSHSPYNVSPHSSMYLPRIQWLQFRGDFRKWEAFCDQFTSLIIENRELVNVNRLQYLHLCLKGEPSDAIKNLPLTDANFKIAWDLLMSRYDNRRRLIHEHIHSLLTLPTAISDSASALMALRDKSNLEIQALRNLNRAVDTWDDILVYLLVQKFDKGTRKSWELYLGDTFEYPSYDKLDKFLLSRIRAFENILPSTVTGKGNKQNSSAVIFKVIWRTRTLYSVPCVKTLFVRLSGLSNQTVSATARTRQEISVLFQLFQHASCTKRVPESKYV